MSGEEEGGKSGGEDMDADMGTPRSRGASTTKKPVLTSAEMSKAIETSGMAGLSRTTGLGTHRLTRGANRRCVSLFACHCSCVAAPGRASPFPSRRRRHTLAPTSRSHPFTRRPRCTVPSLPCEGALRVSVSGSSTPPLLCYSMSIAAARRQKLAVMGRIGAGGDGSAAAAPGEPVELVYRTLEQRKREEEAEKTHFFVSNPMNV